MNENTAKALTCVAMWAAVAVACAFSGEWIVIVALVTMICGGVATAFVWE